MPDANTRTGGRRALQVVLALLSLVPLPGILVGVSSGAAALLEGAPGTTGLDSQLRYLSAVYSLVPLMRWWLIPRVEREGRLFVFVALSIALGGLSRLLSRSIVGAPPLPMAIGTGLEIIAPLALIPWQRHVAALA